MRNNADTWGELERELERYVSDMSPADRKALGELMSRPIIEPPRFPLPEEGSDGR